MNKSRQEEVIKKVKDGRKKEYKKRKKDIKEEGIQGERRKEKEKKKSSSGFKLVRLVLLVFLSVERDGVVERIRFTFLPS